MPLGIEDHRGFRDRGLAGARTRTGFFYLVPENQDCSWARCLDPSPFPFLFFSWPQHPRPAKGHREAEMQQIEFPRPARATQQPTCLPFLEARFGQYPASPLARFCAQRWRRRTQGPSSSLHQGAGKCAYSGRGEGRS